jgi:O-antigen/teichoic acid export membrane protein
MNELREMTTSADVAEGADVTSAPVEQHETTTGTEGTEASSPEFGRRRVVGRNIVVLLSSQVITWSMALVLTVLEPRFLGPEGLGQLRLAAAIWAVVNVFAELGTSTLLTLEFARDPVRANALLRPVIRLRAAAEMLASVVIAVFITIAYDADTAVTIAIVGVGMIIGTFAEIARASLYGLQWMGATARADIITKAVLVVGVSATLLAGGGPHAVALAGVIPSAMSCWILWRALRSRTRGLAEHPRIRDVTAMRRSLPYLIGTAVAVVYAQIDIIVISLVATVDEAGWYAAAATLFGSLLFIPTTFTTSLFPALAQLHEEGGEGLHHLLARSVRSILLLAVPMGVGTIVIAEPLATKLLGADFDGSGPVLAMFGVVLIIMFQTILFGRFAFAIGRHQMYIAAMFVAAVATIPLDLLLVPWTRDQFDNGAIGGALAYIITEGMLLVVSVWKLAPQLLDRVTAVRVVKMTLAGAALAAAAWPLRDQFLALPIVIGGLAYVAAVVVLRIPDDEERHMIHRLWVKISARLPHRGGHPPVAMDGSP